MPHVRKIERISEFRISKFDKSINLHNRQYGSQERFGLLLQIYISQ